MNTIPTFHDPVHDAQRTFRCALDALARPARWHALPAVSEPLPGLSPAATALALTLLDQEVSVWLGAGSRDAADSLRFACGVTIAEAPERADFAFVAAPEFESLSAFAAGSEWAPEAGATVILEVAGQTGDTGLVCSGPGLAAATPLHCDGLPPALIAEWGRGSGGTSCGVDVVLVTDRGLAALPRSVHLQEAACTPQ